MDTFSAFIAEAEAKARQYGWGQNDLSVLTPNHEHIYVMATQPSPDDTILYHFRVEGVSTDRDTVVALLNGD